jgi:hypothetical protein
MKIFHQNQKSRPRRNLQQKVVYYIVLFKSQFIAHLCWSYVGMFTEKSKHSSSSKQTGK